MDAVELRDIRMLLVLAEELHFRRTAERLTLTTARVSQTVSKLERQLGGQLFDRSSRSVTLTAFGQHVIDLVTPGYHSLTAALIQAHADAAAARGLVRIGVLSPPSGGSQFLDTIATFERSHPECSVELVGLDLHAPLAALRRGEVDFMTAWLPVALPGITVGPVLTTEPRVLAVAKHHPLTKKGHVVWDDLADYAVSRIAGFPDELRHALVPDTTPSGHTIPVAFQARTAHDVLTAVARQQIVHPTVASLAHYYDHPAITLLPICDATRIRAALLHLDRPLSSAAQAFQEHAALKCPTDDSDHQVEDGADQAGRTS